MKLINQKITIHKSHHRELYDGIIRERDFLESKYPYTITRQQDLKSCLREMGVNIIEESFNDDTIVSIKLRSGTYCNLDKLFQFIAPYVKDDSFIKTDNEKNIITTYIYINGKCFKKVELKENIAYPKPKILGPKLKAIVLPLIILTGKLWFSGLVYAMLAEYIKVPGWVRFCSVGTEIIWWLYLITVVVNYIVIVSEDNNMKRKI